MTDVCPYSYINPNQAKNSLSVQPPNTPIERQTDICMYRLPVTPPNRRGISPSRTPRRRRQHVFQRPQAPPRHPPFLTIRRPHHSPHGVVCFSDLQHVAAGQVHVNAPRPSRLEARPVLVGHPEFGGAVVIRVGAGELVDDFDGGEFVCYFESWEFVDWGCSWRTKPEARHRNW